MNSFEKYPTCRSSARGPQRRRRRPLSQKTDVNHPRLLLLAAAVCLQGLFLNESALTAAAFQTQSPTTAGLLSRSPNLNDDVLARIITTTCRIQSTALNSIQESIHVNAGFNQSPRQISIPSSQPPDRDNQVAPVYITIGPPCAGKTQALASYLERDGYDPEKVLSSKEVALDEQSDVYVRVPLAAFLFPRTRLDQTLGDSVLRSGTTLRDRLLDPPSSNLANTDTELRNVILRVAGRTTPQEFANQTRAQAREAGDTVKFFRKRRVDVAEDLIEGVEQVSVRAVGEILFQMLQEKEQQNVADLENDLPYDHREDEEGETQEPPLDLSAINATSAHLLSAKALIKTPYVDLFVPQALFNGGIDKAEGKLQQLLDSSSISTPISWGNTNTRPVEYAAALRAAQRAGRPVKFVAWGTPNLPRVPRRELLRRTVSKFRNTGRYVPAGAVGAALGRVERLIQEAEKEARKLLPNDDIADSTPRSSLEGTDNENVTIDTGTDMDLVAEQQENHRMNVALAALAGFVMYDDGHVMKISEPRNLNQNPVGPKKSHTSKGRNKNSRGSEQL